MPDDAADAIVESLIDCREGLAPEEFGLSYLESVTSPVEERKVLALDRVRALYARTGGAGPRWEALDKLLEVVLIPEAAPRRRKHRRDEP